MPSANVEVTSTEPTVKVSKQSNPQVEPKKAENEGVKPVVSPEVVEKPSKKAKKVVKAEVVEKTEAEPYDTAVVMDGHNKVRVFSLQQHGEGFLDLAEMYANKRKFEIKLERTAEYVECPRCSHKFNPS